MIEDLVRHVLHFIHKGGEYCVGIGSDFGIITIPAAISSSLATLFSYYTTFRIKVELLFQISKNYLVMYIVAS